MESRLWATFCILLCVVVGSLSKTSPEMYWERELPDTAMPKVIKDLLPQDVEGTQGSVNATSINGTSPGNMNHTLKGGDLGLDQADDNNGQPDFSLPHISMPHIDTPHISIPHIDIPHINISSNLLPSDPTTIILYFLEGALLPGGPITVALLKFAINHFLLPHEAATGMPFSSAKLPEIYNQFSIQPESDEAEAVKQTINTCELPAQEGQDKHCAASLKSIIDFATSKLGKNVKVLAPEINKEKMPKQVYKVGLGVQKFERAERIVACHGMTYMYTVFYCHSVVNATVFLVPLVGADDTKVRAVAFCHKDTSKWDPKHPAFKVLNVKPGTVPICHFLQLDSIAWLPK